MKISVAVGVVVMLAPGLLALPRAEAAHDPITGPNPPNGATGQPTTLTLTWTGGYASGPTYFRVFMDKNDNNWWVACQEVTSKACTVSGLSPSTTYRWQVYSYSYAVAHQTWSQFWSFTTQESPNQPPNQPANPIPTNGATSVGLTVYLQWTGGDPDGDPVTYSVWVSGINNFVCNEVPYTQCGLDGLQYGTTYQWYVRAFDGKAYSWSPWWSFQTKPNNAPATPGTPEGPSLVERAKPNQYVAAATDPNGDNVRYWFDWGDGPPYAATPYVPSGAQAGASHSWPSVGSYCVRAASQDSYGNSSPWSPCRTVQVKSPPNQAATATGPGTVGVGVTGWWSSGASDIDGDSIRLHFVWGDGGYDVSDPVSNGALATLGHAYANAGTYNLCVFAMDSDGWAGPMSSPCKAVLVNKAPATPGPPTGPNLVQVGVSASYSAQATDPEGDSVRYWFDWGDNAPYTDTPYVASGAPASAAHTWAGIGTYCVRAASQDVHGNASPWSECRYVKGKTPPNVPATPTGPGSLLEGDSGQYTTVASDPDGDALRYSFAWGDGTQEFTAFVATGTSVTRAHAFSNPGSYNVCTVAFDEDGWASAASNPCRIVQVLQNQPPAACFTATMFERTVTVNSACSTDPEGRALVFSWAWGDGTAGSGPMASHTYDVCPSGNFTVKLTVTDHLGLQASASQGVKASDADHDKDGLFSCEEVLIGSDPNSPDTDFDLLLDGVEAQAPQPVPFNTGGLGTDPVRFSTDGNDMSDFLGADVENLAPMISDVQHLSGKWRTGACVNAVDEDPNMKLRVGSVRLKMNGAWWIDQPAAAKWHTRQLVANDGSTYPFICVQWTLSGAQAFLEAFEIVIEETGHDPEDTLHTTLVGELLPDDDALAAFRFIATEVCWIPVVGPVASTLVAVAEADPSQVVGLSQIAGNLVAHDLELYAGKNLVSSALKFLGGPVVGCVLSTHDLLVKYDQQDFTLQRWEYVDSSGSDVFGFVDADGHGATAYLLAGGYGKSVRILIGGSAETFWYGWGYNYLTTRYPGLYSVDAWRGHLQAVLEDPTSRAILQKTTPEGRLVRYDVLEGQHDGKAWKVYIYGNMIYEVVLT